MTKDHKYKYRVQALLGRTWQPTNFIDALDPAAENHPQPIDKLPISAEMPSEFELPLKTWCV